LAKAEDERLQLVADGTTLAFHPAQLEFLEAPLENVFAAKNNKTLAETLAHRRYSGLAKRLGQQHGQELGTPLGQFLVKLKAAGDNTYKKFLNPYGDRLYCTFRLAPGPLTRKKGLYAFKVAGELVYIGRSRDPFLKRFNQGYGKIHPKNCFLDGQATNCHLNARIAANVADVRLYLCPIDQDEEIIRLERIFIAAYKPDWNLRQT